MEGKDTVSNVQNSADKYDGKFTPVSLTELMMKVSQTKNCYITKKKWKKKKQYDGTVLMDIQDSSSPKNQACQRPGRIVRGMSIPRIGKSRSMRGGKSSSYRNGCAGEKDGFHEYPDERFISAKDFNRRSKRRRRYFVDIEKGKEKAKAIAEINDVAHLLEMSALEKAKKEKIRKMKEAEKVAASRWQHPPELRDFYALVINAKKRSPPTVHQVINRVTKELEKLDVNDEIEEDVKNQLRDVHE